MLSVTRSSIARITYFFAFLFGGVSLSLGSYIGFAGIGINDILLLLAFMMSVFLMNEIDRKAIVAILRRHQMVIAMGGMLFLFLSIGQIAGAVYGADFNSIPQLIRAFIYIFIILPLPIIYTTTMRSSVFNILMPMFYGVLISSLLNLFFFSAGLSETTSLVGQNMIGQQVALFMPMSLYLLFSRSTFSYKFVYFIAFLLLIAASFLSLSKASWIGVIIAVLLFSAYLFRDIRSLVFIFGLSFFIIYLGADNEIQRLFEMELSSSEGSGSNPQRIASALSGIYIARDYPFGIGSAYEHVAYDYIQEAGLLWVQPDPHNTLSHIAASGGFGALFCYLSICLYAFYRILKSRQITGRSRLALLAILINGVFLMQFTGEFYTQSFWWLLLGIFIMIGDNRFPGISKTNGYTGNHN